MIWSKRDQRKKKIQKTSLNISVAPIHQIFSWSPLMAVTKQFNHGVGKWTCGDIGGHKIVLLLVKGLSKIPALSNCKVRMRTSRCAIANWKIRWVFAWEISIDWLIGCIKIKRNFPFSMRTKRNGDILPESGNTALQWTSRCPRVQDRRCHQIHNFWIYLIMTY